jgi:hypothetical protein
MQIVRGNAMSVYEMFQLGMSILIVGFFLGYAFCVMVYAFGVRSEIDERLRRDGRISKRSGMVR